MRFNFSWYAIGVALLIFCVRVFSISMDTLRFMLTMRGKKAVAWVLGFIETVLYVLTFGAVLKDMSNVLNVVAYSAGFATGNVVGMAIEKRLAVGHSHVKIISTQKSFAVAQALRTLDYAVTEISARGKDGVVGICELSVRRKDAERVQTVALEADPEAFITVEEITPMHSGYWGTSSMRR